MGRLSIQVTRMNFKFTDLAGEPKFHFKMDEQLERYLSLQGLNEKYTYTKALVFLFDSTEQVFTSDKPKTVKEWIRSLEWFFSRKIDETYYKFASDNESQLLSSDWKEKCRYDLLEDGLKRFTGISPDEDDDSLITFEYENDTFYLSDLFEEMMNIVRPDSDAPIQFDYTQEDDGYIDDRPSIKGKFRYINSTGTESYPDTDRVVSSVIFSISRYGMHEEQIRFKENVTIKHAIEEVEKFLSEPVDEQYFDRVKNDLFDNNMDWEGLTRGDLLSDARYMEGFIVKGGVLEFHIGS